MKGSPGIGGTSEGFALTTLTRLEIVVSAIIEGLSEAEEKDSSDSKVSKGAGSPVNGGSF